MILKDISFTFPEKNIVYDEVLLHKAEIGQADEVLRLWESPSTFVVLGRIGKEQEEVHLEAVRRDQIPVLRRCSGGGTVLQGKGCLNFSLVLSKEKDPRLSDLHRSYAVILGRISEALGSLNVKAEFRPASDLVLGECEKKFSGNAQKRCREYILHHGTILYDFDLQLIEKYLRMPPVMPEYRRSRSHKDFVTNIPLSKEEIKNLLSKKFSVDEMQSSLDGDEGNLLEEFMRKKCSNAAKG